MKTEFENLCWLFHDDNFLTRAISSFFPKKIEMGILEAVYIYKIVKENNHQFLLEIGTGKGGSALIISAAKQKEARFVSLDIKNRQVSKIVRLLDNNTQLIIKNSIRYIPQEKIDFLFIDGNHNFEGVKADFEHYFPYLNEGADILFHDANGIRHIFKAPGVAKFIKILKNRTDLKFIDDAGSIKHFKYEKKKIANE